MRRGILDHGRLTRQASSERIGRYTNFTREDEEENRPGLWFGLNFKLWEKYGITPLWVVFSTTDWGQAKAAKEALEPWASKQGIFTADDNDGSFVVALNLPHAAEKETVVAAIVERLGALRERLRASSQGVEEE